MLDHEETRVLDSLPVADVRRMLVESARIPSYTPPTGHEQAIADLFARELRALGLDVDVQQVEPSRPNIIGYLKGRGGGRSVLFNGHLDTSPPVLGWQRDPYGAVIEGDRLYGHGVSNMKASDVAMIGAVAALKRAGSPPPGGVIVSLVVGECRGGQGTKHMLAEGVRADCFINGEPTDLQVSLLHAGICQLRVITRGRSHHFGMPGRGVNAIEKMAKILGRLGESQMPLASGAWLRRGQDKPEYEGFPRFNVGAIRGGLTPECLDWGPYMTPDYCVTTLDVRFPPGLTRETVREDLQTLIRRVAQDDPDVRGDVELVDYYRPPFEMAPDAFPAATFVRAATDVLGQRPRAGAISPIKFMGGDASLMQTAGIPGVVCGVGTFTSSVPDEYVEISKVIDLAKVYALAAFRLVAGRP